MIVDDDQFLRKVLNRILTIGGHKVVSQASNGAEAISNYLQSEPKPEVILMDHRMPVMNGSEATKKLKEINPNLVVIFISADDTVKAEALSSGAVAFLTKPIRSADLFSILETSVAAA